MSAHHTPGPWRYLEDHEGDAGGRPLTVCDAANNDLANVYSRDDATVDIDREQTIANARLIAAAPDLKDGAAMSTAEMMTAVAILRELGREDIASRLSAQCDFNRAAIAKATGAA